MHWSSVCCWWHGLRLPFLSGYYNRCVVSSTGTLFFIRVFDSWQAGWQSFSYCRAWQPFVRIMADDYAGIFVGILMYVLGAVLVLAGISQIVNLSAARSWTVVPGGFFVIPVLVLIAGIVVLFNPFTAAAVPFIILGVSSIVYGLSDLINIIRFRQKNEPGMPEIEDITPIEEIKD